MAGKHKGGDVTKQIASRARVESLMRRSEALTLRLAGLSYQRIGDKMGISKQAAFKLVTKALGELNEEVLELADQIRTIECQRLDLMQFSIWPRVLRGDDRAILSVLRIMERRARITGIDSPVQIEASWREELQKYGLSASEEFEKLVQMFVEKLNQK